MVVEAYQKPKIHLDEEEASRISCEKSLESVITSRAWECIAFGSICR